jgi:hypothetical protein
MSQSCHKDVTRMSQGCYKDVMKMSKVLQVLCSYPFRLECCSVDRGERNGDYT